MNRGMVGLVLLALVGCGGLGVDEERFTEVPGGAAVLAKVQDLYCDKKPHGKHDCTGTDVSLIQSVRIEQNHAGAKRLYVRTSMRDGGDVIDHARPLCVALTAGTAMRDFDIEMATATDRVVHTCRIRAGGLIR